MGERERPLQRLAVKIKVRQEKFAALTAMLSEYIYSVLLWTSSLLQAFNERQFEYAPNNVGCGEIESYDELWLHLSAKMVEIIPSIKSHFEPLNKNYPCPWKAEQWLPQRCPIYNPGPWKCISIYGKRDWQILLRVWTLKWRDYFEWSSCTQSHHKGPCKPERRESQSQWFHVREDWMGHWGAGGCRLSLDAGRDKETGSSLELPRRNPAPPTPLAQWDPPQTSMKLLRSFCLVLSHYVGNNLLQQQEEIDAMSLSFIKWSLQKDI